MSALCQQRKSESFDHLVGARQQGGRYRQSERLGGLHIDDELETSRLLDRQVCGLSAFEDLVDVHGSLSKKVGTRSMTSARLVRRTTAARKTPAGAVAAPARRRVWSAGWAERWPHRADLSPSPRKRSP